MVTTPPQRATLTGTTGTTGGRRPSPSGSQPHRHLDGKLATISMTRKLARRCYHTLRAVPSELVYAIPA